MSLDSNREDCADALVKTIKRCDTAQKIYWYWNRGIPDHPGQPYVQLTEAEARDMVLKKKFDLVNLGEATSTQTSQALRYHRDWLKANVKPKSAARKRNA